MAITTYLYTYTGPTAARITALTGGSPTPSTPSSALLPITIDDSLKPDLDEVMAFYGYTFAATLATDAISDARRERGTRSVAPTEPAPVVGDFYYDTVIPGMRTWGGAAWAPSFALVTATVETAVAVPVNCMFAWATIIGGGAGGGGGFSAASGSTRGGGGGGGSGGLVRQLIPRRELSPTLYCTAGAGGAGGAATLNGSAGLRSFVSTVAGSTASASLLGVSGTTASQPGTAGTAIAAGTGGAGETAPGNSAVFNALTLFGAIAGVAGTNGGVQTGGAGVGVTFGNGSIASVLLGGTGGAGTGVTDANFAGGAITGAGPCPSVAGGLAGGGAGNIGAQGQAIGSYPTTPAQLFYTGGTGGGSNGAAGTGGAGGLGRPGCGGGGGGGGVTGGAGGNGGDGAILLIFY